MIIIPAIDIRNNKAVRLTQGRFDREIVYHENPVTLAQEWESQGASMIHIVDLDGAEKGLLSNFKTIQSIRKILRIPIQVGGGIRDENSIGMLLDCGITRIILGTRAIEDLNFLKTMLSKWKHQIIVSLDCVQGKVMKKGWTESSEKEGTLMAKTLEDCGLQTLIYTDIARDGILKGPNLQGIQKMLKTVSIDIIASGGIASLDNIQSLLSMKHSRLKGVIVGKALYEKKLTLKEAINLCSQSG